MCCFCLLIVLLKHFVAMYRLNRSTEFFTDIVYILLDTLDNCGLLFLFTETIKLKTGPFLNSFDLSTFQDHKQIDISVPSILEV